jgi:hypothetical protein
MLNWHMFRFNHDCSWFYFIEIIMRHTMNWSNFIKNQLDTVFNINTKVSKAELERNSSR